jgi:hypothetical protein
MVPVNLVPVRIVEFPIWIAPVNLLSKRKVTDGVRRRDGLVARGAYRID